MNFGDDTERVGAFQVFQADAVPPGELVALSPCPHGFLFECDECGPLENRVARVVAIEDPAARRSFPPPERNPEEDRG